MACSTACKEALEAMDRLVSFNSLNRNKGLTGYKITGIFSLLSGAAFGVYSFYHFIYICQGFCSMGLLTSVLSLVFIGVGVFYLKAGKENRS
jgi:hypothetical protein